MIDGCLSSAGPMRDATSAVDLGHGAPARKVNTVRNIRRRSGYRRAALGLTLSPDFISAANEVIE